MSLITPDGKVYPVITGLASVQANGSIEGVGHLLYCSGTRYVLEGGTGKLHIVDVLGFKAGDAPYAASSLSGEDISTFVKAQKLTSPLNSNLYNLTFGPDNNLYITDAGANAITKRDSKTWQLSVFAKLPNVTTTQEAVPTGIVFDGTNFLVSSLSGFPFVADTARLFQVTTAGVRERLSNRLHRAHRFGALAQQQAYCGAVHLAFAYPAGRWLHRQVGPAGQHRPSLPHDGPRPSHRHRARRRPHLLCAELGRRHTSKADLLNFHLIVNNQHLTGIAGAVKY